MSYIGNPPVNGVFRKLDTIAASFNGSTTSFNLTSGGAAVSPGLTTNLIISLGGIIQEPNTAYTVSGSVISFTAAPPAGTSFWGIQLGDVGLASTPNQAAMTTQVFTATAGQTTFTVAGGYTAGQIQVLRNGVQLVVGVDVTATNGTTFVLTNAATAGDTLVAVIYTSFIVANAVAKSGDTMTGNLNIDAQLRVYGAMTTIAPTSKGVYLGYDPAAVGNVGIDIVTASGGVAWLDLHDGAGTDFKGRIAYGSTGNNLVIYSGGNLGINIDSAGRTTTPANPAFFAYPNTTGALSSGLYVFSNTMFNIGGNYSTSTGRFTAPTAGVYHFSYGVQHNANFNDNNYVDLYVNGAQYGGSVRGEMFTTTTFLIVNAAATVYLNANDYVQIYGAASGWGDNAWFSGHLVG